MTPPSDHDQRFKTLLREFFAEFIRLFFPEWAERFDFARLEWLDKELFTDPVEGSRLLLDLVAKLPTLQPVPAPRPGEDEHWVALLHVEVESADKVAVFRGRAHDYYQHLGRQQGLPVWPIALYLRVGLEGIGFDHYVESFWGVEVLHFRYWYIGLPALPAEVYLQGENLLGVALSALMRMPEERKASLKAEALQKIVLSGVSAYRRFLLCECVHAYMPLTDPQRAEFERMLLSEPYKETLQMTKTWFEEGLEKGLERGKREILQIQLEDRFGPLSEAARQRLADWPAERLNELARSWSKAHSLKELGLED